ncbi:MAG TPA: site-specific integrase [Coleofasciculaceae cyanobacterium]|jgi:hypothetical protein
MTAAIFEPLVDIDSASRPETLLDIWERYSTHLLSKPDIDKARQKLRSTQTALLRYTLPGMGGPMPLSERLSPNEIVAGLKFAESVKLVQFQSAIAVLEAVIQKLQADYPQQHSEPAKNWEVDFQNLLKRNKHYLSQLWNWVNEQGWFEPSNVQTPKAEKYRFRKKVEGKVPFKLYKTTQRTRSGKDSGESTNNLVDSPDNLVESLKPNNTPARQDVFALGKVIKDFINPALQTQLEDFQIYMQSGSMGEPLRQVSVKLHLDHVLRILGWLHRVEGVPLDDLRLEKLVPWVKLCISVENLESLDQWAIQSWFAREQAKRVAGSIEATVNKYFKWQDSRIPGNPATHPSSKLQQVTAWLAVAKFVYRFETDQDEKNNFEDIPAIQRLRKLSRTLTKQSKNTPKVISTAAKMVQWPVLLEAVERLRLEAELDQFPISRNKREQTAQGQSMQRFLLLSFMSIMPPDRQRTYRELLIGRTLVKGQLVGAIFTPQNLMAEPQNAKWYIHLEEPDYKTGNTYGSWWGEVPNVIYSDGKTFYGYVEQWLTQWRQIFVPKHEYFFTQPNGKPMSNQAITCLVKRALYRLVHIPMTPHILRDSFVTYLYEQNVPAHILESAALAMHHSRRIQSKVYNQQEQFDKLQSSFSLSLQLVHQVVTKRV